MTEDFINSIKASLYDRTVSPLFGAVAVSWCVWNYRLFVVLLSSMPVVDKLTYVDQTLYGDPHARVGVLILYPIVTGVGFLLIYPYPAKWIYEFWRNRQKELLEIRQRIEDETPLTLEQARQLRRTIEQARMEHDVSVNRLAEEVERHKKALVEAEIREGELRKRATRAAGMGLNVPVANGENESEIESFLMNGQLRLFHNPKIGVERSKRIKFAPDGRIIEGNNNNEHMWRIADGRLELIQSDGQVHSRFAYLPDSRIFVNTNDPDTRSATGQYIVRDWNDAP